MRADYNQYLKLEGKQWRLSFAVALEKALLTDYASFILI